MCRFFRHSSTGSAKGQRPQTAKNDDELAKILALNRKRHQAVICYQFCHFKTFQELDTGGPGNDLEMATAFQRDMNTITAFIISTDKSIIYIVRPDDKPQKLYTVSIFKLI